VAVGIGIFTYRNVDVVAVAEVLLDATHQHLTTRAFPTARGDYKLLAKVDAHGKRPSMPTW